MTMPPNAPSLADPQGAASAAAGPMSAAQAAQAIARGEMSSVELVSACLEQISRTEPEVQAWAYLDPDHALAQARSLDSWRKAGRELGPLHGVPVGIKDIIETADMPTGNGTELHAGRETRRDAAVVAQLRDAGAVIMGKTVTTELAVFTPGKTRNPRNTAHTPGGSSSGSAAAVAAGMVPLAIGTQTAGSILRPASYCGVFGFKPSHGRISRFGILNQSPPLDTVGAFASNITDLALITDCISAYDARDPDMRPHARGSLRDIAASPLPARPMFAFIPTAAWDQHAEQVTKDAFDELRAALGPLCDTARLPEMFDKAVGWQRLLQWADIARNYGPLVDASPEKISPRLREMIEEGRAIKAVDYNTAMEMRGALNQALDQAFALFDVILTPATPGPAPAGEATGDPIFNSVWTYCGVPCLSLPLLDVDGLPLGVQLVGPRHSEGRLLRTARWLIQHLNEAG